MAVSNSVPLGQAGTGSAFILGENQALNRFLENQDYNTQVDRQNALLAQKQQQADEIRRQKAFADGQLNLEAGILFPDVDERVQQFGDKYKNYYIEGGDPNILPDELSRERVLAESASQRRKQIQPVLLDIGKQIRTNPNKYTGRSVEEYTNYLQLPFEEALAKGIPTLEERFNENTFLDKIKVGTTQTEGLVNGRIVQQTTTDPNTVRKSVITGLKGDPAFEAKMQEDLGIPANITLDDIESLPSNVEGIIADTDKRWSGDPMFRQELATQYGITSKDDPKYTAFKNQEALKMFQYKRSVDGLLNDYTQKVIAKNPSSYSNLPDYTGQREARLNREDSGDNASTYRQQLIGGILNNDQKSIEEIKSYLPSGSTIEYKTSVSRKDAQGKEVSKGGYNLVRVNIPAGISASGQPIMPIQEDISLSKGDGANRLNYLLNQYSGEKISPSKLNIEGGKPRGNQVEIKGQAKSNTTSKSNTNYSNVRSIKSSNGDVIQAGVKNGKWYNTKTGKEIK